MALILRNGGSQSPDRWLRDPRNNQEEDRPIYEYGFQILIEIFLWVLCCTIIAALTCSLIELCIFFIIFFPIRSYAGGFHFRKFSVCLPFSCTTFLIIIYLSRIIIMPRGLQLCNSFFCLVWFLLEILRKMRIVIWKYTVKRDWDYI